MGDMTNDQILTLIRKMRKDLAEMAGYVAAGEVGDAAELAGDWYDDAEKLAREFLIL